MPAAEDPAPWRLDRPELTLARVRALVRRARPGAEARHVAHLASGWDFDAWRVDDEIVRFPRRATSAACLERELAFLPALAPHLTMPVPVPLWRGEGDGDFPHPFAGYAFLPGETGATRLPAPCAWPRFAAGYGRFVRELHAVTPADVHHLRPPEADAGSPSLAEALEAAAPRVAPLLREGVLARVRAGLDAVAGGEGPVVLAHADLGPEHWILDDDGRLAGVIDWTDAQWTNEVADWLPLGLWLGPEVLRMGLAAAGHRDPARVLGVVEAQAPAHVVCWAAETARWSAEPVPTWLARLAPRFLGMLR